MNARLEAAKALTKEILLTAAEDVQSGMWCRSSWFEDIPPRPPLHDSEIAFQEDIPIEDLLASRRCAEGSLQLATRLVGGDKRHFGAALWAVAGELTRRDLPRMLQRYNDWVLPDDPVEAGRQCAEVFRAAAEFEAAEVLL